jgi:hypothetical protein
MITLRASPASAASTAAIHFIKPLVSAPFRENATALARRPITPQSSAE